MLFRQIIGGKVLGKLLTGGLAVLLLLSLSACTPGGIVILEDGHQTGFTMDLKAFSDTNKCELPLAAGDEIQVKVEREGGQINLSIRGKKGSEPYEGKDLQTGSFTVTVSETDEYLFTATGKNATGKITVKNLRYGEK